jgi:phage terminase small subunit
MAKRKAPLAGPGGIGLDDLAATDTPLDFSGMKREHKRFVQEYINNKKNATRAYMAVYAVKSPAVAQVCASQLLLKPMIRAYLEAQEKAWAEQMNFTREKWLSLLVAQATVTQQTVQEDQERGIETKHAAHGLECKASDRKAAMDELRDVLGFKTGVDTGVSESSTKRVLGSLRERIKR